MQYVPSQARPCIARMAGFQCRTLDAYPLLQSFVVVAGALTTLMLPMLVLVLRTLTFGAFNYLPAGPTPILFAILAQYHAAVPHVYQYRLALSAAPPTDEQFVGVTFSNKSYKYFLAIQLALSQWPGSLLSAVVGWTIGYAWRTDLLPGSLTKWRVPGWLVGMRTARRRQEFDGLRRRLEDEDVTGAASGSQVAQDTDAGRRRTVGQQIFDEFRGSL